MQTTSIAVKDSGGQLGLMPTGQIYLGYIYRTPRVGGSLG